MNRVGERDTSSTNLALRRLSSLTITSPELVRTTTLSPRRIDAVGEQIRMSVPEERPHQVTADFERIDIVAWQ